MDNRPMPQTILQQTLLVPALAAPIDNQRLYYLFGLLQVEAILQEIAVRSIPFSAPHVDGLTEWRGQVVPVISLERYLSLDAVLNSSDDRFILVRTPAPSGRTGGTARGIFRVHHNIQRKFLSEDATAERFEGGGNLTALLKGTYRWDDKRILIVDLQRLLWGDSATVAPPFSISIPERPAKDRKETGPAHAT